MTVPPGPACLRASWSVSRPGRAAAADQGDRVARLDERTPSATALRPRRAPRARSAPGCRPGGRRTGSTRRARRVPQASTWPWSHLDAVDPVEPQRRQRERDQAGDPLAGRARARLSRTMLPTSAHGADEHAARPGGGVVQLARARRRSPRWPAPRPRGSPPASAASWRKLRRVEVQAFDVDQDLGVRDPRVGVELPRRLREGARRRRARGAGRSEPPCSGASVQANVLRIPEPYWTERSKIWCIMLEQLHKSGGDGRRARRDDRASGTAALRAGCRRPRTRGAARPVDGGARRLRRLPGAGRPPAHDRVQPRRRPGPPARARDAGMLESGVVAMVVKCGYYLESVPYAVRRQADEIGAARLRAAPRGAVRRDLAVASTSGWFRLVRAPPALRRHPPRACAAGRRRGRPRRRSSGGPRRCSGTPSWSRTTPGGRCARMARGRAAAPPRPGRAAILAAALVVPRGGTRRHARPGGPHPRARGAGGRHPGARAGRDCRRRSTSPSPTASG